MSEKTSSSKEIVYRLLKFAMAYKKLLITAMLCTLLLAIIGPFRPWMTGYMVDEFIMKNPDKQQFLKWTIVIAITLVLEGVLQFASSYFSNLLAQSIILDIRQKLFAHISRFKMRYFDKNTIGSMITRVVSDLEAITEVFSAGIMGILADVLSLILVVFLMFYTNWQLAILTIIPIPLLLIATKIFAKALRTSFQQEQQQVSLLNSFVQERITGMALVQLFNRQKQEYIKFQDINKGHREAHIKAVWANSIFFPIVEMLSSLSIAFLLVWGAITVLGKTQLEAKAIFGQIIAFILWVNMLFRPIRQLAEKFNILQRGIVRANRVFNVIDTDDQIQNQGEIQNMDFNKNILFEHVWFAYQDEQWVLKDINLEIKHGTTVAFVGATGAGKSSIVNLLGRYYEFQKGSIYIGSNNINDVELEYLRNNIAFVLQDVFLFSDTILKNITLGDPKISLEQVIDAAKQVGAHDFIDKLPGKYNYQVGERGGVLSVGQRQLLSFIRACVYNPSILVLDEATSSVDNESEALIQRATEKLTEGRTSIVIAHRLSTIQKADQIVVLDHGEIKEIGTHQELLKNDGYYKKLYDMQFSEEIKES